MARWIELVSGGVSDAVEAVLEASGGPRKLKDIWPVLAALAAENHAIHADLRDDETVALSCGLLAAARGLGQFEAAPAPPAGLVRCEATIDAFTGWLGARGYRLIDLRSGNDS